MDPSGRLVRCNARHVKPSRPSSSDVPPPNAPQRIEGPGAAHPTLIPDVVSIEGRFRGPAPMVRLCLVDPIEDVVSPGRHVEV
jgi:hypothetical protein